MINKKYFFKASKARFVLAAALLSALTGCVGYVDGPRAGVYVAPPVADVGFAAQDDYVYYPKYEMYYSASRHQYAYRDGNNWVSQPAPRGVTVDVLMRSPAVKMNFHDSPANHHTEVVKQYPKNWKPSGSNQGQKENQKDGQRDDHGDNGGR
jgi:hypothetical protein